MSIFFIINKCSDVLNLLDDFASAKLLSLVKKCKKSSCNINDKLE